ncbi:unnamed protein product [Cylindrotheca closterium]|uniref:Uncharacterized protein n=1 Tax=Cylindrotheca closterium TaxID=2856 RepID=A0AAD2FH23_9STRA|nr:unnamed protein product [Cylindrotheca closterium]
MKTKVWLSTVFTLILQPIGIHGFASHDITTRISNKKPLLFAYYNNRGDAFFPQEDMELLHDRIRTLKVSILEDELKRPPNTSTSPTELVQNIIQGLLHPFDPLPDAGFRLILRTATKKWKRRILHSVGANDDADAEIVASALGAAIGRPDNQFAILVGEGENFTVELSEPLNFGDECWLECRLRDKNTSKLLVITGWNLVLEDGMWLVDNIDWQDFRESFRPGIGREEWMRDTW